ncbi:RNA polymerase sigma factor [Spirosoma pomorum]
MERQHLIEENQHLLHLWQQAQAGDKMAFCRLAESQYRSMFRYATNFTSDTDFIKDTIQDVFINIWEKRQTITIQFVAVYFFKSLRNQFFQEFRRSKPSLSSLETDELGELSDWQTIEANITQEESESESQLKLRQAVDLLPKRQQEVVFLKFYKNLDNEQIADLMEINRQSVANLLYRALTALKGQLSSSIGFLIALVQSF